MKKHLSIDYSAIGQRVRAYRIGTSLRAEELARYLGISRAAVYRMEKGDITKIDVLDRLARLLDTSMSNLLGVEVEYYANASVFFERMRQLEEQSTRILAHFDPFSFLLTSPSYINALEQMLAESYTEETANENKRKHTQQLLQSLAERKKRFSSTSPQISSLIGIHQIEKFLYLGLIGTLNIPPSKKMERVLSARKEVLYLIEQLEEHSHATQVAIVDDTLPNQTFEILYRDNLPFSLAVSPFRLGEFPNINTGIASVTSAPDTIRLYENLFDTLWSKGAKGSHAIDLLKKILARY